MWPCLFSFCIVLWLLGCQSAPTARPAPLPTASTAPIAPKPPIPGDEAADANENKPDNNIDERRGMSVLRTHLLHLVPCQNSRGEVVVRLSLDEGGIVRSLRTLESNVPEETTRCVLARLMLWRFPKGPTGDVILRIAFPLVPPSLSDHLAVSSSAGASIDLLALSQELRRLRPKVLLCYRNAPRRTRIVLLALRLGPWGRFLSVNIDSENRAGRGRELPCLRNALRQGRFPNPVGGEIEVRYPYVF